MKNSIKFLSPKNLLGSLGASVVAAALGFSTAGAHAALTCTVGEFNAYSGSVLAKDVMVRNTGSSTASDISITLTFDKNVSPIRNWGDVESNMQGSGRSVIFSADTNLSSGSSLKFGFKGSVTSRASSINCTASAGATPPPPPPPPPTPGPGPTPGPTPDPGTPPGPNPVTDKCPASNSGAILFTNFDNFDLGKPGINDERSWRKQFCTEPYTNTGFGADDEREDDAKARGRAAAGEKAGPQNFVRVSIVDGDDARRGRALRVLYPDGGVTPSHSGFQAPMHIPGTKTWDRDDNRVLGTYGPKEMYISYWVKFEDDFTFQLGGKLPGMFASRAYRHPDGEKRANIRLMWRKDGKLEFYIHAGALSWYDANGNRSTSDKIHWKTGRDISGHAAVTANKWHHIEFRVKLNSVSGGRPNEDGILQGWLDGEEAAYYDRVVLTDEADANVNTFFFSTFFGGSGGDGTKVWWPLKDVYAVFDNIEISPSRIGCCSY